MTNSNIQSLRTLFNNALLLFQKGEYVQSAGLYQDILARIKKEHISITDIEKAELHNWYGLALKRSGNLLLAKLIYKIANKLTQYECHNYLNNLAVCMFELGDYSSAGYYYRKAIQINSSCSHHQYDPTLYWANYGVLMAYWGKIKEATEYLLSSYNACVCDNNSSDYAHTLFRLANIVYWMGYYEDSLKITESAFRAMALYCRTEHHPRVGEIRLLYARILLNLGDPIKAKEQLQAAFSTLKTRIVSHSPMFGRGYLMLAECSYKLPDMKAATLGYLKDAYRCFRKTYRNPYNPDIADYYMQRAEVLIRQKSYHKAIINLKKALQMRLRLLVKTHPVFAENYHQLGFCYAQLGNVQTARKMYLQSLHSFKAINRRHIRLPDLLKDIALLYPGRRVADLCTRCSIRINIEKPSLINETAFQDVIQPVPCNHRPTSKPVKAKRVQILLLATSDMQTFVKTLSEKLQTMIDYYEDEAPKIQRDIFVQDNPQASTISFEDIMIQKNQEYITRVFVCFAGYSYGIPAKLRQITLKSHPWITNYRDRSEWELVLRYCAIGQMKGTIYYLEKSVSKTDIQNPYLNIQSLLQDFQRVHAAQEIDVKKIQYGDLGDIGFILFTLNAAVLKARELFRKDNDVCR